MNPQTPEPSSEMSQLDFFIGTFKGKGKLEPPTSEGYPIQRTIMGKMDLDGFWLFVRFEDEKTEKNVRPVKGNWQLSYDDEEKKFIAIWTDNLNRGFKQTSTGWDGDVITFTGSYFQDNQKIWVRDIFIKKDKREMELIVEVKKGDGEWIRFLEVNCTK